MKTQLKTAVWASAVSLFFAACQKESTQLTKTAEPLSDTNASALSKEGKENKVGNVYTLNNQVSGNKVMAFNRSSDGLLTFSASYSTGGNGTGGGLGNQGALVLADDGEILLAVNPGSNSVSSFKVNDNGLSLKSTVSSGGMRPVSIARHDEIVFVLNAGGTNNISGFKLKNNGMLEAIPNSTRPLSAASTGPAQVSFVNEGKVLVVTEKGTNKIITYTVNDDGMPGMMHSITSSSPTPFGFAVRNENIFVSEAVGGAPGASVLSSYQINYNGVITLADGSVGAGQSAACWVVITNNGKYAYTTNTASNNLSTFGIKDVTNISVEEAIAGTTEAGPIDAAVSNNSKYLFVLNGAAHSIQSFEVAGNGTLTALQTIPGLPAGATGLVSK
jgi:6-phosphogluconolactonase (cycloisomerase 2 family)